MNILLAEDDQMIGENVQIALKAEGIFVDWLLNGAAVAAALRSHQYDALILDLGLPQRDGLDILRDLRARGDLLPVLIMSARASVSERVKGLQIGADDYLVKPFDLDELIARIRALVRRASGRADDVYVNGDVSINTMTKQALVGSEQVILSAREWAVLDALLVRPGAILSRSQLEEKLFTWSVEIESNAIEVYIHGLRKKLGQKFIINVRGVGYMVEKK